MIDGISSDKLTWLLKMAIEIVDLPIKNGGSFDSYVNVYQEGYYPLYPIYIPYKSPINHHQIPYKSMISVLFYLC